MKHDVSRTICGLALGLLAVTSSVSLNARTLTDSYKDDCASLMSALLNAKLTKTILEDAQKSVQFGPQYFTIADAEMPWASHYYPFTQGGIARRWKRGGKAAWEYALLDEEVVGGQVTRQLTAAEVVAKLKTLSAADLGELSPTEKLDIYMGNYDFKITRRELMARGPRRTLKPESWEGFCNGVCAVSTILKEPSKPVSVVSADGVALTFEPSDIKGLLSASYYYVEDYAQMGAPNISKLVNPDVVDAAAFDVGVRSYLGTHHKPFVFDVDPGIEIWNEVAVGYGRQLGTARPFDAAIDVGVPQGAAQVQPVRLELRYLGNDFLPHQVNGPTGPTARAKGWIEKKIYTYDLYLDTQGEIVGGKWTSKTNPDFVWFPGGRGMDSTSKGTGSNPHLDFDTVKKLADASAK